MNARSTAIQGALAFVVLVLAYTTWQRPAELNAGEVFILDITKNDLEKVRFEDTEGKSWSELAKGKDNEGTFTTVRMSGYDNTGTSLPSGHPGIALKMAERLVRGNESAQKLFDRFAPMRAIRALGVLDAAKIKELGLDSSKKFLEVSARGWKRRFAIVPAPPGGSDPYVRDLQDNKVYIVPRPMLSDMQTAATNLVERRLHDFRIEGIDRLVLTAGGKRRDIVASRIEEYPGVRLAPADKPDKPDPTLKNWHDRIFSLFPTEVLGQGEQPAGGPPVTAIRIEYFFRGRSVGFVELARGAGGAVSSAAPSNEMYARSEFTLGWVRMPADTHNLMNEGETLSAAK